MAVHRKERVYPYMRQLLNTLRSAWRTKRTVVYECRPYLHGTYTYESYDLIRSIDLVDTVLMQIPEDIRRSSMFSMTDMHASIRITAVW